LGSGVTMQCFQEAGMTEVARVRLKRWVEGSVEKARERDGQAPADQEAKEAG